MKHLTIALATLLLASQATAAPKLKTFPLDEFGCVENVPVKKGEHYRIRAKIDGMMLIVPDGYAAYATLYNAAGKAVQPERATYPDGNGEQFAELRQGNYVFKINQSKTIKSLCVNAAN
nr:hypothetical protein [uncultured Kingella sp.]